jgi:hypothetical protein
MLSNETLAAVLTSPTPAGLWHLRGDLLQTEVSPTASLWAVLDRFFDFLNELSAHMSAHEYHQLASFLDVGAMGGVVIQNLLAAEVTTAELWQRLLVGGFSEGLLVLASRQYVKSAEAGMAGVYNTAAWYLYQELWQISAQLQPELSPATRRQLVARLLDPIHQESVQGTVKAALIGRLFQVLLLVHLKKLSK